MITIKAVFFDVDGTIYSHRHHDVPASTKETLQQLKQKGYKIGIATSRCRYETANLPAFLREFAFDAAFYDGGALVMEQDQIIRKSSIDIMAMNKLVELSEREHMALRYATFDQDYFAFPCDWRTHDEFFQLYLNMPITKPYAQEEVFNVLVYAKDERQHQLIDELHNEFHIVRHGTKTIELTAPDINKSRGIETMAKHWNIACEEMACFGDGVNDIQMLKAAGLGIAMGNAIDLVKEAADMVCDSVDEDGIYKICKQLAFI